MSALDQDMMKSTQKDADDECFQSKSKKEHT